MPIDLQSLLCREAGFPVDAEARAAVSRLLLAVAHDANGFLGTAMLRTGSSGRALSRLKGPEPSTADPETLSLLHRLETNQSETELSLNGLRSFLDTVAELAWTLQEPPEGPVT